ncbi:MAG: hypothetical protein Q7S50_02115 [bacterium]|nr:hypothetical protein [bacterium]
MRNTLVISVALAVSLPLCAYAEGINSITISSSETGGTVSGATTTSGSASASAHVRNVIGTQGTTSTIEVKVKTERDGVVRIESVNKNIEGTGVKVKLATSTGSSAQVPVSGSSTAVKEVSEKKFFTLEPFLSLFRSFFSFFRLF